MRSTVKKAKTKPEKVTKAKPAAAKAMPTRSTSTKRAADPGASLRAEKAPARSTSAAAAPRVDFDTALDLLRAKSTPRDYDNLARFGIVAPKSFGVSMANLKVLAKRHGRDRELAAALWDSGWYEARMLATLVDEPARVTPAQMESWCRDFDNWAICDTACFALFDRTPHAWDKIAAWRRRPGELQKRAAFALLASLALHDKKGGDEPFVGAWATSRKPRRTSAPSSRRA